MRALRPESFEVRRDELRQLVRRSREAVVLAAITGVVTGLAVRGFEFLVEEAYHQVLEAPLWLAAIAPGIGLVFAAIILRLGGGASPSTSDEYLRAFHDPAYRLRPKHLAARIGASVATLGSGGALGLEGPSLYGGSAIGSMIQRRLPTPFRGSDHRTLLVAGAAAGVAAIFKAPATGAIFALEVPYRDDMARRMLLPALVASATGYLTFVTLSDTTPLLAVSVFDIPSFEFIDLLGALLVGAICAVGARGFAKLMRIAKGFSLRSLPPRLIISSASMVGLFFLSRELTGLPLSLGAGYEVFTDWLFIERDIALWLLFAVFMIRCLASAMTTAGGGVGGVFIPLVVGGGLVGRGVATVVHPDRFTLYTLIGIAAFLGAGYRVPLAAVMFVAETTGKPNFVVPALIASVAAELVMGEQSITAFQRRPGQD
ncbi:chloride channel protein [Ilumatobacter sp.]|uniref:chloride channel protein n=1 Tax=Ilumatobacter sp. TaxID=1967498 RepID=UPI003AF8D333